MQENTWARLRDSRSGMHVIHATWPTYFLACLYSSNCESQVYAMVLPDHDINPRVPCKSGVLKSIDFSKWRDASFHKQPGFFSGPPRRPF